MSTSKKVTVADKLKKGYNEKNPTQAQGSFTPDSMEQPIKKSTATNAEKMHHKNNENKKEKL